MGTDIIMNGLRARGLPDPEQLWGTQLEELIPPDVRAALIRAAAVPEAPSIVRTSSCG